MRKFKSIPFQWEGENYLLKIMKDTQFLATSSYGNFFNFSTKSDPFLVFPSSKHSAVGGGAHGLKKIKAQGLHSVNSKKEKAPAANKLVVPLPNSLMKMVR